MVRARDDHPRFPAALARAGAGIADRHRLHGPRCWAANRTGPGVGRICRHRKRRRIAAAPAAGPPLAIPRPEQDVFRRRCRVVPVSRSPRLSKYLMAASVAAENITLLAVPAAPSANRDLGFLENHLGFRNQDGFISKCVNTSTMLHSASK